jgi:hypothetical protein
MGHGLKDRTLSKEIHTPLRMRELKTPIKRLMKPIKANRASSAIPPFT